MPRRGRAHRSVTVATIRAERRPITTADLRRKLREVGAETAEELDETVGERAGAAIERELGPLATLLAAAPKARLAVAVAATTVVVAYRLGELVGRPRGPSVEVRPISRSLAA